MFLNVVAVWDVLFGLSGVSDDDKDAGLELFTVAEEFDVFKIVVFWFKVPSVVETIPLESVVWLSSVVPESKNTLLVDVKSECCVVISAVIIFVEQLFIEVSFSAELQEGSVKTSPVYVMSVPVGGVTGHTSSSAWFMQSVKQLGPFILSHWYRSNIVSLKKRIRLIDF